MPSFVSEPVPVPMMLLIVVSPAPPTVRPKPEPVIVPVLSVSRPASELIRLLAPSVTAPAYVLSPLMFRRAPLLFTPEPLSERASPVTVMPFWSCSAPPLDTVDPPPVPPSARAFWMLTAPAEIVVAPV